MIVVVVACQKGGSGKTTLSGHLAVEAEKSGAGPVALIDTDPQGSLSHWWNSREAKSPHFAKVGIFELKAALQNLRDMGFRIAIIDTPPAITVSIAQVIQLADLVIVPTRPSPHDLRAVGATAELAQRAGKPLMFVVNGATQRARITGESAIALSQHGVVAPVMLHHRVDFAASMVDGRTVGEVLPKSASAKEMSELWTYVQDRIARLNKDAGPVHEAKIERFSLSGLSALDESEPANDGADGESETEPAQPDVMAKSGTTPRPETVPAMAVNAKPEPARTNDPEPKKNGKGGWALFNGPERKPSTTFGRRHFDFELGGRK